MSDVFTISVPSKAEYVNVVRLTTSAVASRMGFNIEEIEDIKVAVAEACTNAIKYGNCACEENLENFNIKYCVEYDKMIVEIQDNGKGFCIQDIEEPDLTSPKEGGLGIFIIRSLMDEVDIMSAPEKGTIIKMIKYLGDDI
ncbi:MAG: ATP-binding protein [Anaeromicrobium sp.]|jgi:serine/threonine-protein kinase RsbW|uniref:ATP-binding protein n=1 Tax=Anaeromicrobium sp. TaxID=1929132 RepID=UPI0025D8B6BD|nr:ATP-binding protein [Anaeromicrobium sp.]MCT4594648.1 ATP-binding protein [Anaeromicrobium sp.]